MSGGLLVAILKFSFLLQKSNNCTFSSNRMGSYWAGEEMTRLENTQEVGDGEAAKHQAHGQQGGVGVGPLDLQLVNGDVTIGMVVHVLRNNWDERVIHGVIEVFVVEDQRVGLEDLRGKAVGRS